jgi:putative aldouronate transport system permease protein
VIHHFGRRENMTKDNSLQSRILDVFSIFTLLFLVISVLFPIIHIFAVSISSGTSSSSGPVVLIPKDITWGAYEKVFKGGTVPQGFVNSVFYTLAGTAVNLTLTILTAYPLSKKKLPLRKFYTLLFTFTMFFGGGMIPNFLLIVKLNMYNTVWALLIPGAVSTWNLIIMRTFFQAIPEDLAEAAAIDGANDLYILFKVVLPLSKAAIATIGLFYAVSHWNSWLPANMYLRSKDKYPLQLILRGIVIQNTALDEMAVETDDVVRITTESIKYATLFVSIIPMALVYPFIQKYFTKGVMVGSLKG